MESPSLNPQEYRIPAPEDLFKEYVRRVEEYYDDPKLQSIEGLLNKMGLEIKMPDDEKEEFSHDPIDGSTTYTTNIYLYSEKKELVSCANNILITIPPTLKLDHPGDMPRLKEWCIRWP